MYQSLTSIFRFFISHDFFIGVNTAFGVFIPVVILYFFNWHFDYQILLITAYGSLTLAIADQTGPLKHKFNELLGTLISIFLISCIYTQLTSFNFTMILALTAIVFVASFITAFGRKTTSISFVLIFTALMAVRATYSPFIYLVFFSFGAIFYFFYALIIAKIFERYIIRQNLSSVYFYLAKYLKALSECYRQNSNIEKKFKNLIDSQSALLDQLQLMRDLLFRQNKANPKILIMVNELIILIEARETASSPLHDFILIRKHFPNTDIQIFFRDSFSKAANNLEEMGLFTLRAGGMLKRLGFKAELRALEYEIELLKRDKLEGEMLEGYQVLIAHYRKTWSLSRYLERLRTLLIGETKPDEKVINENFSQFLSHDYWSLSILRKNFNLKSDFFRYAIRTSAAMFAALLLTKGIMENNISSHAFWIAFTLISLMRPGFSLTRERSQNRIIGTILGCIIGGILISMGISHIGMVAIIFVSVILSHGLGVINNRLSVAATTVYVLILLNINELSSIEGFTLASERIIDTIIAAAIAIGFSNFVLPYWEKDSIPTLQKNVRNNLFKVLISIEKVWIKHEASELELKLILRECQTSIVTLSNSITRMQNEPKRAHSDFHLLTDDVLQYQSILSQLSYLATLLANPELNSDNIEEFNEIFELVKLRMNPDRTDLDKETKPFTAKELKPLIWMLESY